MCAFAVCVCMICARAFHFSSFFFFHSSSLSWLCVWVCFYLFSTLALLFFCGYLRKRITTPTKKAVKNIKVYHEHFRMRRKKNSLSWSQMERQRESVRESESWTSSKRLLLFISFASEWMMAKENGVVDKGPSHAHSIQLKHKFW